MTPDRTPSHTTVGPWGCRSIPAAANRVGGVECKDSASPSPPLLSGLTFAAFISRELNWQGFWGEILLLLIVIVFLFFLTKGIRGDRRDRVSDFDFDLVSFLLSAAMAGFAHSWIVSLRLFS